MKKLDNYYVNRHSCFLLQYHLVLVTKYRHPVLVDELRNELINYTKDYFSKQDMNILSINTDKDHIHILFECSPNIILSNFVNAYKSASSRTMRKLFADFLSNYYWKPYFWSQSYFISTVSETNLSAVQTYINNQSFKC